MMCGLFQMDANGMLQKESALELAKNIFPDPDELKMVEDYLHSCSHSKFQKRKALDSVTTLHRATFNFYIKIDWCTYCRLSKQICRRCGSVSSIYEV